MFQSPLGEIISVLEISTLLCSLLGSGRNFVTSETHLVLHRLIKQIVTLPLGNSFKEQLLRAGMKEKIESLVPKESARCVSGEVRY